MLLDALIEKLIFTYARLSAYPCRGGETTLRGRQNKLRRYLDFLENSQLFYDFYAVEIERDNDMLGLEVKSISITTTHLVKIFLIASELR